MSIRYLLPDTSDNVAITTKKISSGEIVEIDGNDVEIPLTIPKGHRFAVKPISAGAEVTSWSYAFGFATRDIAVGDYLCNDKMRGVLEMRDPQTYPNGISINFVDRDTTVEQFIPEPDRYYANREPSSLSPCFTGYHRSDSRGWGTRNYVAVIGITSMARNVVLSAVQAIKEEVSSSENFHGVVPVVHTEGGASSTFNNRDLVLRTLAGFAVNSNLAAAIFVSTDDSSIQNDEVLAALQKTGSKFTTSTVRFFTAGADEGEDVNSLRKIALPLISRAARMQPGQAPLSALKLGLQCGGSDAFSGITANPLLGGAVERILAGGGIANLAETDELIGAEQHVLAKVRDENVISSFLAKQNAFKDYAERHGQTAEGNVSGGNIYRGLYNITLKSLGAGRKKDPATALDYVIGYGEAMDQSGYCFMDSPGNDLESIAGQVASGANMILFTTGNGSITNFPFVPTIKIVTTTERFNLLDSDMDFNAGSLMEGKPFEAAADELYELTLSVASGKLSKGEMTGQSQVQIWRDWHLTDKQVDSSNRRAVRSSPALTSRNELVDSLGMSPRTRRRIAILPTSLCSGQVAEQIAAKANGDLGREREETWEVVALPHTEGCGVSGGEAEDLYARTMIGYADHRSLDHVIFLEHGCEKTHNDYFADQLQKSGIDSNRFGWASIQRAGGIDAVTGMIRDQVDMCLESNRSLAASALREGGLESCLTTVGIGSAAGSLTADSARTFASLVDKLLNCGVDVVVRESDELLSREEFVESLGLTDTTPTLEYGSRVNSSGLHIMQTSSDDWAEASTGMGASGVQVFAVSANVRPVQPHRFLPTIQFSDLSSAESRFDYSLAGQPLVDAQSLAEQCLAAHIGTYRPVTGNRPNTGFQLSRGFSGVSL